MSTTECDKAAARVSYQLAVRRASIIREFGYGTLTGEDIDCANTPGELSRGGWYDLPMRNMSEDEWVAWFQMMAIQECVHEALEWFKVDGKTWLDPHIRDNKIEIHDAVMRLWEDLKEIRTKGHTYG